MFNSNVYLNDVLFCLYAADQLNWPPLARTHIQRALYLAAVLSKLSQTVWDYEFSKTLYGPFNGQISLAPDLLVHQGYVEVIDVRIQSDSKLKANYRIREQGVERVEAIAHLRREKLRLTWIRIVMKTLTIYGPSIMSKLAYSEPTFARMKLENRSGTIDLSLEENESIRLISKLTAEMDKEYSILLDTPISNLILYFDYLSRDIGTPKTR